MLTNKILSVRLDIPINKIRRWTKEFLQPDPEVTLKSGHARKFSSNDGFYIYLGGYMVSKFGLTFSTMSPSFIVLPPYK